MQEGFEYIHVGMFNGCSNIIKVSIPNSIKKIDAAIDTGSFIYGKTFGGARKVRELYWNIDGYSSEGYSSEYNVGYMFDLVSTGSAMGMDYYWQEVNSEYRPYRYCMDAINDGKTSITRIITYDEHEIEYDSSTVAASYSFEKIILGPNVRYIPTSAFKQCTFLREITIPDSVGGIGRASFAYAYCLEKINTNKVIYLGDYAFYNSGIRELVLNSKVEAIGAECFGETDLLKKVFWNPNASCKYTHENFARNEGGNYIKYPYLLYSSIKNESGGYSYTGTIEELTFGTDCTEIPLFAFAFQDKIKSLIIPDNIEYIKDKAFFYCSGIEHLDLGNGVQRLGAFAFRYCTKLKEITLPNSIKYMESMVFRNTGIETINYNIKNGYIWMDNGYISTEDYPPLTYCPATTVNIAPDVTKLGNYAFGGMLKLQSITIPTSIPKSSLKSNMFWSCTSLTEILYNGVNILGTF